MLFVGPATSLATSLVIATTSTTVSSPIIDVRPSLEQSVIVAVVPPSATAAPATTPTAPALQIIVAYGKLAGPTCYGSTAPPGSSCQLPLTYLQHELGLDTQDESTSSLGLTREEFKDRLNSLPFQWPLKPYGRNDKTLSKTSTLNKGAETAIYMDELEKRGLYDRRNPTGPLPTNMRPEMNAALDGEGVGEEAVEVVFDALVGDAMGGARSARGGRLLTVEELVRTFGGRDAIDYYGFLELVGDSHIQWPRYSSAGE